MIKDIDTDLKFENYLPVVKLYNVRADLDIISASQLEDDFFNDIEPFEAFFANTKN